MVALFLDVKEAFPSTVPEALMHDMRKRGVSNQLVEWYERNLEGHNTIISFNNYQS